jgi:hypothetical protein
MSDGGQCGSVVGLEEGHCSGPTVTCGLYLCLNRHLPVVALAVIPVKCGSDTAVQFDTTGSLDVQ